MEDTLALRAAIASLEAQEYETSLFERLRQRRGLR